MAFDNTPNKLESAFIQRSDNNDYYQEINISGSDIIFYHDSSGKLTADRISVWAALYNIGRNTGSFSDSASWASSSISSSYSETSSYVFSSISSSISEISLTSDFALLAGSSISSSYAETASYALNGNGTSITTGSYNISTSWASSSISSSYVQTASYALNNVSSYALTFLLMGA